MQAHPKLYVKNLITTSGIASPSTFSTPPHESFHSAEFCNKQHLTNSINSCQLVTRLELAGDAQIAGFDASYEVDL